MSIWTHKLSNEIPPGFLSKEFKEFGDQSIPHVEGCRFCGKIGISSTEYAGKWIMASCTDSVVGVCNQCGWWYAYQSTTHEDFQTYGNQYDQYLFGGYGALKSFSSVDHEGSLEEIRTYLLARYETRFHVNAEKMEHVVGSVFSDLGFQVKVTAFSRDGGIDVVLSNAQNEIAVQVKRTKNTISVSQIREFIGAIVHSTCTRGIFVTTSTFSKEAIALAETKTPRIEPIELIDGSKFLDALEVTKRPLIIDPNEIFAEVSGNLHKIDSQSWWRNA